MTRDNPLLVLRSLGQSIWLDYLDGEIMSNGRLARMIQEEGVCGVTSNPSILEKALEEQSEVSDLVVRMRKVSKTPEELYELLAIEHVSRAAKLLSSVHKDTRGVDGYVSIEVSPQLANDIEGSCAEAQRLWEKLSFPNVMVKVPGTEAGVQSMRNLTAQGINVNTTLLFTVPRYKKIADAYMSGLEDRVKQRMDISRMTSVASFFLSRIDTLIDKLLAKNGSDAAKQLAGVAAIACAKIAYQEYLRMIASERWQKLAKLGARPQRLLWASTSTKNPAYSDVKYVDALIGRDTVNTLPLETLDAYRDHGKPAVRIEDDLGAANRALARLESLGVRLDEVGEQLEHEGREKFREAYDRSIKKLREQF